MTARPKKAVVFEETYKNYLKQLSEIDYMARAATLGVDVSKKELIVDFYGQPYRVSKSGITDKTGDLISTS